MLQRLFGGGSQHRVHLKAMRLDATLDSRLDACRREDRKSKKTSGHKDTLDAPENEAYRAHKAKRPPIYEGTIYFNHVYFPFHLF